MTTVFFTDWKFSPAARRELQTKLTSEVVSALEVALNYEDSYRSARPPTRKKQIENLKNLRAEMVKLEQSIYEIDEWTISQIGPALPFRDFKDALAAYIHAADHARLRLAKMGPERGPDPEFSRLVVWRIATIFRDNNLPIGAKAKDIFVQVIGIAFGALNIAGGEARKFASLVIAGKL